MTAYTHSQDITWKGDPGYIEYLPPSPDRLAWIKVTTADGRKVRLRVRLDSPDLRPREGSK